MGRRQENRRKCLEYYRGVVLPDLVPKLGGAEAAEAFHRAPSRPFVVESTGDAPAGDGPQGGKAGPWRFPSAPEPGIPVLVKEVIQ